MTDRYRIRRRSERRLLAAGLAAAALIVACGEDFEGGAACPMLCPEQNVVVYDTAFDAISFDTTITGIPTIGTETELYLAYRGDTVDVRPVVRFDSLPIYYNSGAVDTVIQNVDSAYVKFTVNKARSRYTERVTFELFDVDTIVGDSAAAANDTTTALERLLFRPDRRIGTVTLDTVDITDSLRIPIDSAPLAAKIIGQKRLRLGLRATSAGPVHIRLIANEGGDAPVLRFIASQTDSAFKPVVVIPRSVTPRSQATLSSDLTDYVHVISAPSPPSGTYLTVGGVPARRPLLRFDIPSRILDSSNVLRATLELTQYPVSGVDDSTKLTIFPLLVTAGTALTDPGRSAFLTNAPGAGFDSVQFTPRDSGKVEIEIVNALRAWALSLSTTTQRGIVLRAGPEGVDPRLVSFFSSRAPAGLRPRLRVSYSPVRSFGIP